MLRAESSQSVACVFCVTCYSCPCYKCFWFSTGLLQYLTSSSSTSFELIRLVVNAVYWNVRLRALLGTYRSSEERIVSMFKKWRLRCLPKSTSSHGVTSHKMVTSIPFAKTHMLKSNYTLYHKILFYSMQRIWNVSFLSLSLHRAFRSHLMRLTMGMRRVLCCVRLSRNITHDAYP